MNKDVYIYTSLDLIGRSQLQRFLNSLKAYGVAFNTRIYKDFSPGSLFNAFEPEKEIVYDIRTHTCLRMKDAEARSENPYFQRVSAPEFMGRIRDKSFDDILRDAGEKRPPGRITDVFLNGERYKLPSDWPTNACDYDERMLKRPVMRVFDEINVRTGHTARPLNDWAKRLGVQFSTPTQFTQPAPTKPAAVGVAWEDIVGLDAAKKALREVIELPQKHAELFNAYGLKPTKGVLLYGPPGCGKTMLMKAAAKSLGGLDSAGFQHVNGPALINKFQGESERAIREIFNKARAYSKNSNRTPIIFIDEADAILSTRSKVDTGGYSGVDKKLITQFLAEMDGVREHNALVVLATNREGDIDPAVLRNGRIDRKIEVPRPGRASVARMLEKHLSGSKVRDGFGTVAEVAARVADSIFSDSCKVREYPGAGDMPTIALYLRDIVNGALVAGIVQRASYTAIHEDIEAGDTVPKGILLDHLLDAVLSTAEENEKMDHTEVLKLKIPGVVAEIKSRMDNGVRVVN